MIALRGLLGSALALIVLALGATSAAATPAQQFTVALKDFKSGGRYSVVYTSNAFDTEGATPPALAEAYLRMPRGMAIKKRFLKSSRLCETGKFVGLINQNRPKGVSYAQMVDGLPRRLRTIEKRVGKTARKIVATCRQAFLGSGRTVVDARPLYDNLIPARFALFLSKPTVKGAIAGISVLSHYDRKSPLATNVLREIVLQPTFSLNVFNAPTKDGRYGYRVKLLAENSTGLRFSVAELQVTSKGLSRTIVKRKCTKRRGGKCVRSKTSKRIDFWATLPKCPASGKVPFRADYRYTTGLRTRTVIQVSCPRYVK